MTGISNEPSGFSESHVPETSEIQTRLNTASDLLLMLERDRRILSINDDQGNPSLVMPFYMAAEDEGAKLGVWEVTTPEVTARLMMVPGRGRDGVFSATVPRIREGKKSFEAASDVEMDRIATFLEYANEMWKFQPGSSPEPAQPKRRGIASKLANLFGRNR